VRAMGGEGEEIGVRTSRRSFLGRLFAGTVVVGALGVLTSIAAYLLPPERVRSSLGPRRVKVGEEGDIPIGAGKLVLVDEEPVWVVHVARGFVALSAFCTHKGCVIKWEASRRLFGCPCHDGRFDERGNVLAGPPRRPLTPFRIAVVGGDIYVSRGDEQAL
jgi:Rieske Fe-S protein